MTANDSADASYTYIGSELDLFALASNWEALLDGADPAVPSRACSGGWCGYRIEYGGARRHGTRDWTCLEPDVELAGRLARRLSDAGLAFRVVRGTTADIPDGDRFDCALYIDVLEHIADDRAELRRVSARLRPGGRLIVLAPAHQFLFSAFDEAVGHCPNVLVERPCSRLRLQSSSSSVRSIWIPSARLPRPPTAWCCGSPCRRCGSSNSGTACLFLRRG